MNTFTVSTAVTPTVVSTFLSHVSVFRSRSGFAPDYVPYTIPYAAPGMGLSRLRN